MRKGMHELFPRRFCRAEFLCHFIKVAVNRAEVACAPVGKPYAVITVGNAVQAFDKQIRTPVEIYRKNYKQYHDAKRDCGNNYKRI